MSAQGIIQGGLGDFPENERATLESQGIKSLLALPIMVSGEWFGFVGFDDCTKERVWNDSDISILKTAAEMIGTYFERKRTESLTTIQRDLAVALGGISNLNKALQLCLDTALKASEMDSGGIYLRDKNTGDLKMIMHRGVSPEFAAATTVHKADSKNTKLVMKGEPVYSIYSNLDIPINQLHISENLAVIAVLPVKHEEKVIACLIVASHALEEIPTPTRNILETIATQIGGAIAHLRAEQEIQQLATMIQQAGEGVVVCDMLDIITFVNTSFAKMHGYENPDQLIKKNISILHTNEHIATNAAPFKEEVIKKGVQSGIMHHRKKDNTVFPVEITANIINDENNDPIGIIAFITDITDRLKSQKALRQSEERLELALKGANLGLWDWNLETDEAVFNERWAQMLGYEIEEIQNQAGSWKTLTHPDDVEKINRNVEAHWEGRTPEYETEHRLRSKSGEWIWVLSRGKVVQRNEDGKPLRMVGTHLDITERKKAADAIKNERDKAQRYLDVAGVILIAVEKDHTVSLINKAGCQILECEEKDIIGKDWFDTFLSPEIKNKVKKIFNQLIAGEIENTEHYENEIITAKGNRRTIAWHNSILHNKDGKIIATLGSGEDITERKIAQEKIERSERMFRGIYDNANDGICLVDADAKSFFMCNNKFCEMLGYTEVELKKMHVKDIHPQEILESIYQLIKDGIDKTNVFAKDIPAVKKNGEVFYSDISGASVPMMDKKYVIGMFRDSTERRETDLELKRQHDFVTNVIETTPAFFIVVDLEGNTVSMNSAILAALGYQLEEVVGKPFLSTFVPKREWDQQLETFKEYTKNEKPAIYDSHLVTRDGNELLVEWHSRSIFDSRRRQKQFFAIGLNITERKKLETQLLQAQKMQTLGTLAGGVAHDYNNLLVGVLGFASIISASPDASATTRSHAAQIENTARRMADLTRQLLGFGRGGKWTTRILDVNDSIRESIKIVHGSLHREISLKLRLSPQPCCIEGDPGQILQVITNCCINAIEATGSGGAISIKTKAKFFPKPSGEVFDEWKPGDYVHIEITDNGCGMSQETLAKMFEPYFSTKSQGRGLGMAAVFGIIKNHQGWLSVDTESGTGTHMHIYLPRVEGEPQKMPTGEIALTMEKSSGKIIVIDDEQVVRQLCRNVLRKVGYNVLTAHSGNQGLRLLEKHPDCDLLLLDMVIPRPSGNKVFKKARAMYPNLKILLTSGHDDHGDIAKLIKKDAVGFLAKPFAAEELANRIRTALNADKK